MIRHIVSWNFREGFSDSENKMHVQKMKKELEALKVIIPGIISFRVIADILPTSNHDVAVYSLFESEEALAAYQPHPEHLRVSEWVGTVMKNRVCIDFEE